MAHPHWPLFDLEVRTPRLSLRYIDDELANELVALAAEGIHDPDFMPFARPWSTLPSPRLERESLQFYWRCRAATSVEHWDLPLAVIADGQVVGGAGLIAEQFPKLRQFETGSWLGREHQGQGLGKELRYATLTLGFVGFDAEWALTSAWHDNEPSLAITRKLGYTELGHRRILRSVRDDKQDEGHADLLDWFEMPRSHFADHVQRDDITLHGIARARDQLGVE